MMEVKSLVKQWVRTDLLCDECRVMMEDTGNRRCSMGGVVSHKIYRCPKCGKTLEVLVDKSYPYYEGVSEYVDCDNYLWLCEWKDGAEVVVAMSKHCARQIIKERYNIAPDHQVFCTQLDFVDGCKVQLVKEGAYGETLARILGRQY